MKIPKKITKSHENKSLLYEEVKRRRQCSHLEVVFGLGTRCKWNFEIGSPWDLSIRIGVREARSKTRGTREQRKYSWLKRGSVLRAGYSWRCLGNMIMLSATTRRMVFTIPTCYFAVNSRIGYCFATRGDSRLRFFETEIVTPSLLHSDTSICFGRPAWRAIPPRYYTNSQPLEHS